MSRQNEYRPTRVTPPGMTLGELLQKHSMSQAELSRRMGRPKKTINEIIRGKASITPATALELECVFGIDAQYWIAREGHYREYMARATQGRQLKSYQFWLDELPVRRMEKLGWIQRRSTREDKVRELLSFFGVASPDQWKSLASRQSAAFRKSFAFKAELGAMSAWLRRGVEESREIKCASFSASKFKDALQQVRSLTVLDVQEACDQLVENCRNAGVAVVFIPELPGAPVSGATHWVAADKVVLQLTIRYRTDDHFWFSFFHEAGHILLHGKELIFLDAAKAAPGPNANEQQANRFAADFLIPPDKYAKFSKSQLNERRVCDFARDLRIAPGIVVGRLQHDGYLPYNRLNHLKTRLKWDCETQEQ